MKLLKFNRIVLFLLTFHISFSALLIFVPSLELGFITTVYRRYLLPGPFFTEDRIEASYACLVSIKQGGVWSPAFEPALDNYHDFTGGVNIKNMYQSRFDRHVYYQYLRSISKDSGNHDHLRQLMRYYQDKYVPKNADSVRFLFLKKDVTKFRIATDTLYTVIYPCHY